MCTCSAIKLTHTIKHRNDELPLELYLLMTDNTFPILLTFVYEHTGSSTKDGKIVSKPTSAQEVDIKSSINVDESEVHKGNDNIATNSKSSEEERLSMGTDSKKEMHPISEEVSRL